MKSHQEWHPECSPTASRLNTRKTGTETADTYVPTRFHISPRGLGRNLTERSGGELHQISPGQLPRSLRRIPKLTLLLTAKTMAKFFQNMIPRTRLNP
jgi:ABC-type iron transport system FetAB ATPase subunit